MCSDTVCGYLADREGKIVQFIKDIYEFVVCFAFAKLCPIQAEDGNNV
jgi:hypothetical protein